MQTTPCVPSAAVICAKAAMHTHRTPAHTRLHAHALPYRIPLRHAKLGPLPLRHSHLGTPTCTDGRFRTVSRADRSAAPSTDSARADVVKPCSVQVRRPAFSETAVHPLDASHALAHHSARPGRPCTYDTAYDILSTHSGYAAHQCRCTETGQEPLRRHVVVL